MFKPRVVFEGDSRHIENGRACCEVGSDRHTGYARVDQPFSSLAQLPAYSKSATLSGISSMVVL